MFFGLAANCWKQRTESEGPQPIHRIGDGLDAVIAITFLVLAILNVLPVNSHVSYAIVGASGLFIFQQLLTIAINCYHKDDE